MMGKKYVTVEEIANAIGGIVWGNKNEKIYRISLPQDAVFGDLTYFEAGANERLLHDSEYSACIVPMSMAGKDKRTCIIINSGVFEILDMITTFFSKTELYSFEYNDLPSISSDTVIGRNSVVGNGTIIGSGTVVGSNVSIGKGVRVGDDCIISNNVVICSGVRIGNNVSIQPGSVIGADSFEYAERKGRYYKVFNLGSVVIHDKVEIGANTTIDRGVIGDTIIDEGTIIDNLVQVGHEVRIGKNCKICSQCGLAGWSKIESDVVLYGKAGVSNHVVVKEKSIVLGMTGVTKNTKEGQVLFGVPGRDRSIYVHETAKLKRIISDKKGE